jgi:hypothetical protein
VQTEFNQCSYTVREVEISRYLLRASGPKLFVKKGRVLLDLVFLPTVLCDEMTGGDHVRERECEILAGGEEEEEASYLSPVQPRAPSKGSEVEEGDRCFVFRIYYDEGQVQKIS